MALIYLRGLVNEEAALDSVLGRSRQQLDRIPAKELQFARLQREAKGLEEIVTHLQSRLKEAEIAQAVEDPSVRLVDAAVLPREPVSPKPLLNLSLATMLGLALGISGALLREYLDRTVRSRKDILLATGVPVLGLLPRARSPAWWKTALGEKPSGRSKGDNGRAAGLPPSGKPRRASTGLIRGDSAVTMIEAYNLLDTNLAFARPDEAIKVLTITSPLPGEGKTTVAVNLALTLARRGARVLLVDADLRCGIVCKLFEVPQEPGLSDVLLQTVQFGRATHAIPISETTRLHLLSRGKAFRNPAQLLGSSQVQKLLASVRTEYDSIIIDTPPTNIVADAAVMGAHSDGVIIVARAAVTEADALAFAMTQLEHVRARVIGAVLNDIDFRRDSPYDKAYHYYTRREAYAHTG
jgi:capsular exopolysaccharide synthesis family protein